MVENNHVRWDFIGLSTDTKPTPADSENVTNGSTFYCSDTSKLYVWYNDQWYEKQAQGGGGGGPTVVQSTGTSTTDVMSQNAVTLALADKQDTLAAGSNISISGNTISATDTTYTAGTNVSISANNEISATDTTYSDFTGTDGSSAGTAGLVPAPATTDAGKFLKADGTWDTAGGSSVNVVQTTGTSTTDVMSQNAVTSMVFADPANRTQIQIGANASTDNTREIAIGNYARCSNYSSGIALGYTSAVSGTWGIAIGSQAHCNRDGGVAIGAYSGDNITANGIVDVGSRKTDYGYNNSNYRLISGVYDPQSTHDAATKGYVDPTTDSSAPTSATVGRLGEIRIDTTTNTAYMCVVSDSVTPAYEWKQITT